MVKLAVKKILTNDGVRKSPRLANKAVTKQKKKVVTKQKSKVERPKKVSKPLPSRTPLDCTPVPLVRSQSTTQEFPIPQGLGIVNVKPPDWSIAIPSYDRTTFLKERTLAFLGRQQVPAERIFLFVANEEEAAIYEKALKGNKKYPSWKRVTKFGAKRTSGTCNLVIGIKGIGPQRAFITDWFPEGHHVVSMDDDVKDMFVLCSSSPSFALNTGKERMTSLVAGEFEKVILDAGVRMLQTGAYIWSVSRSQIVHHLQCEGISTKFNVCVGYCFGVINRPALKGLNTIYGATGDDVERSMRFMKHDGLTLHYRMLAADTKYREGEGGINSEVTDRPKKELDACIALSKEWPLHFKVNKECSLASGLPMDIQHENFPNPLSLQTAPGVPGIQWVPPAQRPVSTLPAAYKSIVKKFPPYLSARGEGSVLDSRVSPAHQEPAFPSAKCDDEWKKRAWPRLRATFASRLCGHANAEKVGARNFWVELAGYDLAGGFGLFGFGNRHHYSLRNDIGLSAAILDTNGDVLASANVDTYNSWITNPEFLSWSNRVKEFKGKVFVFGTRNTAVTTRTPFPAEEAAVVAKLVGKPELLPSVGYRQPYVCMGVIGSSQKPLEATGGRGELLRFEAMLENGKLEQKKLLTYDVGKSILEAVPPGDYKERKEKLRAPGPWANDPIDLVEYQATKKLKLSDFPKFEFLTHVKAAGEKRIASQTD